MNKRQAKKRRKKQAFKYIDTHPEFFKKLGETLAQIFAKWLESGMPIPEEGEKNE